MPCLRYVRESFSGEKFLNCNSEIAKIDLNRELFRSPFISFAHAQIIRKGHNWILLDLGSKNGTYLNKEKLEPYIPSLLSDDARIQLGIFQGSPRIIWSSDSCSHATLIGPHVWSVGWLEEPPVKPPDLPSEAEETGNSAGELALTNRKKLSEVIKGLVAFLTDNQSGLIQIGVALLGIALGMASVVLPPIDHLLNRIFLHDGGDTEPVYLQGDRADSRE